MELKKRRRLFRPYPLSDLSTTSAASTIGHFLSLRSLFSFLLFLLLLSLSLSSSRHASLRLDFRRPTTALSSLITSSVSNSLHDLSSAFPTTALLPELRILNRVSFPDYLLIFLSRRHLSDDTHAAADFGFSFSDAGAEIDCVYRSISSSKRNSTSRRGDRLAFHPVLSADEYDLDRWMVRCPPPPLNYSGEVGLQWHRGGFAGESNNKVAVVSGDGRVRSWIWAAYEAVLDGDTAVVLVKGLHLRREGENDPSSLRCRFTTSGAKVVATTTAVAAAQEVVRCPLPLEVKDRLSSKDEEMITVTVDRSVKYGRSVRSASLRHQILPSVAKLHDPKLDQQRSRTGSDSSSSKFDLCGCTMTWNQASSIREWVIYHSWLGVQRWFVYDNNSDDGLKQEVENLDSENYNITRHAWPWIKTQEAGFSHCVIRAKAECKWVAFFDVDEFYYFPRHQKAGRNGHNSLVSMVSEVEKDSSSNNSLPEIGEIRTKCHSFGPSGLSSPPARGVTVGYTCRLILPERHKSIIRPEAVDDSLANVVHHFKLREGFRFVDRQESSVVINHYKYQVWDAFKAKFFRRVSTYVTDWKESQNEGSRDRAPGLGTEAIEPVNWRLQFCEVWDNGLRDFVVVNLADPSTGLLPWEREMEMEIEMGKMVERASST